MELKIKRADNYPKLLIDSIICNKDDLPKPLPWIEPSINNLYLEACSNFLYGNYFSSITCISSLLEHVLRLALVNKNCNGLNRNESIEEIDRNKTLAKIIDEAKDKDIFDDRNLEWWNSVRKLIRNKSAHYLLPVIIKECSKDSNFNDYFADYMKSENNNSQHYEKIMCDWGAFFHKTDRQFAKCYLRDSCKEISIIINNTNWISDESWWISQKHIYDAFFKFNWNFDNTIDGMKNLYIK